MNTARANNILQSGKTIPSSGNEMVSSSSTSPRMMAMEAAPSSPRTVSQLQYRGEERIRPSSTQCTPTCGLMLTGVILMFLSTIALIVAAVGIWI